MADFDSLYSKYMEAAGVGEQKRAEVAAASASKKAQSVVPDFYKAGAATVTGKGSYSMGEVERDLRTLNTMDMNTKYGHGVANELRAAQVQGSEAFRRDTSAQTTGIDTLTDLGTSVGLGFGSSLTGVGALAVGGLEKIGLAPDGAGAFVADKATDANQWVQSQQSEGLQARRRANQAVQSLDERDHLAMSEDEAGTDGELLSSLKRVGRDVLSGVSNAASDPDILADGIATGVGSLYAGGVLGKGLKVLGEGAAIRSAVGATGPSRAGHLISEATKRTNMPIAIGALEGGGAYQQTADRALEMGATPEEANDAGLMAAGIQAPIGVATGALVSKFEGAPLAVGSLRNAGNNILRETVEEGIQSGSGQLAQNTSLKTYVDPTQDLAEGVGAQVGQGALFGMGTAGALQAPGVAIHGAVETGKAARELGAQTVGAVMGRGAKLLSGLKAEETQRATDAQSAAVASAPEAQQQVKDAILAKGLSPEETAKQTDYVDRVFSNMGFDPAETQAEAPIVQAATQGATDRFTALRQVAQVANDPSTSETDRALAGAYLLKQYSQYQGLFESDLREAINQVDDAEGSTDPNLQHLDKLFELEAVVGGLREHPEIADALAKAQEAASSKAVANQFNDKAMSTPEGQQAAQASAQAVIELAGIDPAKADPEMLEVIRAHAVAGRLQLTPEQRGILTTATTLIRATRETLEQKKALGLTYADKVTNDVQTRDEADASEVVKKSGTEHAKGVLAALRVGDRDLARSRLGDFAMFAQHMQNKVDAFNRNYASGRPDVKTSFQALSSKEGRPWFEAPGLFLNAKSESSVQLAQQTALDARAVATLVNGVSAAFPELGIQSVTPVALGIDPDLNRKATDVVKEHQEKKKATPKEEIKPEKVAEERPAEKVEPAPKETQEVKSETKAATELDPDQQPLPFEKPVEPLKEAEQPLLPMASDDRPYEAMSAEDIAEHDLPLRDPSSEDAVLVDMAIRISPKDFVATRNREDAGIIDTQGRLWIIKPTRNENGDHAEFFSALRVATRNWKAGDDFVAVRGYGNQIATEFRGKGADFNAKQASVLRALMAQARREGIVYKGLLEEVEALAEETSEPFADLVGSAEGQNWFKKAYSFPEQARSRLVGLGDQVIDVVAKALATSSEFEKLLGSKPKYVMSSDVADTYRKFMAEAPEIQAFVEGALARFLNEKISGDNSPTMGEALADGQLKTDNPLTTWVRGKALNIVEVQEDGSFAYNPELLQGAVLAGLQWFISTQGRPTQTLTLEDVAELLKVEPAMVRPGTVDLFNNGHRMVDAKRALAQVITRFWGVESNKNAPEGFVQGIPEAMAGELLDAMISDKVGLLVLEEDTFMTGEGDDAEFRTYQFIKVKDVGNNKAALKSLAAFPDAIEQLSIVEPEQTRFFDEPPKQVSKTQLRNRLVKLKPAQMQMITNGQNTPHNLNMPVVSFYENLGLDLVRDLFGHGALDEARLAKLNVNHARSLKGKNLSIEGAFEALMGTVAEARGRSSEPAKLSIFYRYSITKVGRLMMEGLYNPQASKLVREAILPTRANLDLTQPENLAKFRLAVAQAWGVKVHKQPRALSAAEAQRLAAHDFADALTILDGFLSGEQLDEQNVADLKRVFGKKLSPAAIHAGIEMARYFRASEEERADFETHLYVEADGMTNGPIMALYHLAAGAFDAHWINLMAKGGLYLGSPGMNAAKFIHGEDGVPPLPENRVDLYETTSDGLQKNVVDRRKGLPPAVHKQAVILDQLMDILLPDVRLDDEDNLVVDRGVVKNPLTITVYGASEAGIANNVAGAIMEAFYQELSKALSGEPNRAKEVGDMIETLSSSRTLVNKTTGIPFILDKRNETVTPNRTAREYTLSPSQIENLTNNVGFHFVKPMVESINSTMGATVDARNALRKATQVQSIFAQYAFVEMVRAKIEEKPVGERKNFLSEAELKPIYDELLKKFPLIETDEQAFFPSKSSQSDIYASKSVDKKTGKDKKRPYVFGRTLADGYESPAYVSGPSDVGVGGIPGTVIGFGDGLTIQKLSTMEGSPKKKLPIFDGVHLALDTLDEDGVKVNQAVYDSWQTNPLSPVNDAFQAFYKQMVLPSDMPLEMNKALARALLGSKGPAVPVHVLQQEIKHLAYVLQLRSDEALARHRALARVEMSVDQMSSVEAPYQAEGGGLESLEGMTAEEQAIRLNKMYEEELVKIRAPKESLVTDQVQEAAPEGAAVTVTPASGLLKLVRSMKLPAEQKNLLLEVAKSLQRSNWRLFQGETSPKRGLHGIINTGTREIHLYTDDPQTLLHELLHAAVTEKILGHYHGQTTPEVSEAISHLETLMMQWMEHEDLSGLSPDERYEFRNAMRQVRKDLNTAGRSSAQNKAAALDEFLAWNLSNQDLIRLAQRTKVANPIARVVKRVLVALKNLIWGRKMAPMVRSDMYSALRFNASVLINSTPTLQSRASKATRFQSVAYGTSDRLTELHEKLGKKLYNLLNEEPTPIDRLVLDRKIRTISGDLADRVYAEFENNGFRMTPQEHLAFVMMLTVFATQAKLDPAALSRAQELFAHVNKTLTVEDFMSDPTSQDPNMRLAAQKKFSVIKGIDYRSGRSIVQYDDYGRSEMVLAGKVDKGRSTLLPAFLALAAVNDEFREVLAKLSLPKSEVRTNDTLDNLLTNAGNNLLDGLSRKLSGEGRGRANVQEAIDALTDRLAANVEGQENMISQLVNPVAKAINGLNDKTVGVMQKTSKALIEKAEEAQAQTNNKYAKGVLEVGKGFIAIANESEAKKLAEGLISTINQLKIFQPAHDLLNDLIGRTESNAPVYDLIKRTRSMVQQMRQQFREHLPGLIDDRFSRPLTKEEWTHLFKGLARTDLAALAQTFNVQQVLDMLKDPKSQEGEIRRLEDLIESEAGQDNWRLIEKKARQLAVYMNTGVPGSHLLRNSQAVAGLFGVLGARPYTPTPALIGRLDQLISLYALEGLDSSTKDALTSLVQDEAEGMAFTLSYLVGQRTAELSKVTTDKARVNHYKGYVPSEPQGGAQLLVANDSESTRLIQLGYKRAGKYAGSLIEPGLQPKSYWFAPVSSRALFQQGIMQNVRQTASGVDPVTGHSHGPMTAGRIVDPRVVKRLARYSNGAQLFEPLLPIFDEDGEVIAFERSIDPVQELRLNRDTNLARMIGVWRGRQAEESLAGDFNKLLINQLHNVWTTGKTAGRANEFVDLMDPDFLKSDPVAKDAVSLFTPDALEYIRETFGGDGFKVRRDMLNDAIGYRSPSVGDLWTGNTRLHPDAADTAKRLVMGVFGVNAYRNLVTAEKLTQNLVSEARQLIVVKSVIVPVSNFIANIYQMASRGVNLGRIARDVPKKLVEVNAYVQRRQRQIELEAELRAAENNVVVARRINAELQSILDANKRMTIWPLIEAGEFSSISDAGSLDKEETTLFEGNLTQYIEQQVDKLPKGIRTAGKYALITQDTALFQGMRRAMEYGDFLAKAVTYDHLTQEKKLNTTEALARITEEYVNYDRLSGRFRTYTESMGLMWFWNFKVRIAKIAVATIRDNPVQALLTTLMPTPDFVGSIGTPMSDNLFTMGVDGDLGWSMGPGMGFRSYEMNPWIAMAG